LSWPKKDHPLLAKSNSIFENNVDYINKFMENTKCKKKKKEDLREICE
jgi:hypothetical protein